MVSQDAASRVVKLATSNSSSKMDLIYSKEGFMEEFAAKLDGDTEFSEADFDILLIYLSRDSGSIAYDGKVCYIVKVYAFMRERAKMERSANYLPDDQVQAYPRYTNRDHPAGYDHCLDKDTDVNHDQTRRESRNEDCRVDFDGQKCSE